MFSYYGSKSKIITRYPAPVYELIVEPFAGSARYSLMYADHKVHLNDSYKVIADIWEYLISATPEQIYALPELERGADVRKLGQLSEVERNLMGYMVNRGVPYPHHIYTTWAAKGKEITRTKHRILSYLEEIRHWNVSNLDYQELENVEATWFIDPPYKNGGHRYINNGIDYGELAEWCQSRRGQVIVCENSAADWLPFQPLKTFRGQRKTNEEVIWTNSQSSPQS